MRKTSLILIAAILSSSTALAQGRGGGRGATTTPAGPPMLLVADRVWSAIDDAPHDGWVVLVRGDKIEAVGPRAQISVPADAATISLPGTTLLPGLIEGHSHLLLHPYNETPWNDQVLHETEALRVARAVNHARATLMAGFTTVRDLGTEGAGYADVGLKQAVNQGIIPGPRLFVSTRAIVATGAYGPAGFTPEYADAIPLRYPVRVSDKKRVLAEARGRRIELGDWYPHPIDLPNGVNGAAFGYQEGMCPEGERAAREVINLPMHGGISEREAQRIVDFLKQVA